MIHNFKTEIKKKHIDPTTRNFLIDLYKAEEKGFSNPNEKPSSATYELLLKKALPETESTGERDPQCKFS